MSVRERREFEELRAMRRAACEAFVDAHYRGVHRFFLWLTNDPDAAADLTQETFAAFWQSLAERDEESVPDLKAWLYGIARNRWRKRCRDSRGFRPLEEVADLPDGAPGPQALALAALEADEVARAGSRLPADFREALVLRVFQELGYAQVGEALGIGEGLARWRVHRARAWLSAALGELREKEKSGGCA